MLLNAARSSLLIVDMQERLLPAMAASDVAARKCEIVMAAAKALSVPLTVSEQYPKGLGHTVPQIGDQVGNAPVFEKDAFSCWRDEAMKKHFIGHHDGGRPQVVIAGIEAHVCVLQTALDMAQAGFAVFVVADATTSRAPESAILAFDRMRAAGVSVINTEMAVFELLGRAGTAEFKALSALIR
jgi:nicotinamidase-related amidase